MNNQPVGIMDSGVGGLTVAAVLRRLWPKESILYIGDSARNPYGERSKEDIAAFAEEMKAFLLRRGVKAIIVACNTITFNTPPSFYDGPVSVVGMSTDFSALPRVSRAAVFATPASISAHSHRRGLERVMPDADIVEAACPGLAAAIETGTATEDIRRLISACIEESGAAGAEAAVLGCTHYPLVRSVFEELMPGTIFLDPAEQTVTEAMARLALADALAEGPASDTFCFTAKTEEASRLAASVFGGPVPVVDAVL